MWRCSCQSSVVSSVCYPHIIKHSTRVGLKQDVKVVYVLRREPSMKYLHSELAELRNINARRAFEQEHNINTAARA